MIGVAAGMALSGKRPWICSFSTFVVGRFEVIRMSVGYTDSNVKIVGTHCGVAIGEDGYSQMALEDIALMRTLPNMTIIQPADDREAKAAVDFLSTYDHPAFFRLTRQGLEDVHGDGYSFHFGKADVLRDGADAVMFCTGGVVAPALKAAEMLAADGLDVRVVNIHTIKPLDEEYVAKAAAETGRVITVEDHNIHGGLGGAVAEVLAERQPTRMLRIGMTDYGRSGTPSDLYEYYGLNAEGIALKAGAFLKG
jgi:transketolase